MPPASAHHNPACYESLSSGANLAQNIAVVELTFGELEHTRIADRADFQASEVRVLERRAGAAVLASIIWILHSEAEEFRHRHQLVESRPVDAERVNVAADHVR